MYLRRPHAGGAVAGSGARGEDPAPALPGDQVGGGEQGEGGAVLAVCGDPQVVVALGDVDDSLYDSCDSLPRGCRSRPGRGCRSRSRGWCNSSLNFTIN